MNSDLQYANACSSVRPMLFRNRPYWRRAKCLRWCSFRSDSCRCRIQGGNDSLDSCIKSYIKHVLMCMHAYIHTYTWYITVKGFHLLIPYWSVRFEFSLEVDFQHQKNPLQGSDTWASLAMVRSFHHHQQHWDGEVFSMGNSSILNLTLLYMHKWRTLYVCT